jgi:hypothetical protein
MKKSKVLIEFETLVGLGSTKACIILGVSYPAYAKYRSGARPLPLYHHHHVTDIGRLSRRALEQLIVERIYGN